MLKAVEQQSYQLLSQQLQEQEIDYLQFYSELDECIIEAADGYFIEHACYTPQNKKGKVYAVGFIYALWEHWCFIKYYSVVEYMSRYKSLYNYGYRNNS